MMVSLSEYAFPVTALLPSDGGPEHGDWRTVQLTGSDRSPAPLAWVAFRLAPREIGPATTQVDAEQLATRSAKRDGVRAFSLADAESATWRPLDAGSPSKAIACE